VILSRRIVDQAIDTGFSGTFLKELVVVDGPVPLAMVRKRLLATAERTRGSVLLIHGFGQNRYAFHLPARSFSAYLAHAGFDVYNLDLRGHGRSRHMGARRPTSIVDYVTHDMPAAIEEIRRHNGGQPVFLVGHSLGGLVSYFSAPALGDAVNGIATIGSPYHFTRGSFSLRAIGRFFRMMELLHVPHRNPGIPLKPVSAFMRMIRPVADSRAYLFPLRGWHRGATEAHVLDQHLKLAFDRAGLAELRNMFDFANAKRFGSVARDFMGRFEKHDVPLLVIAGENDDLAPPKSVEPGYRASGSTDKRYRTLPLGHIDLLCGREARKLTWSLVREFIDKRTLPR
jgi:polyhydroxyalkanoate synthase